MLSWSYGVTTCTQRLTTLLPNTLESLAKSGFDSPRLFIDGCYESQTPDYLSDFEITCRYPAIGAYGNWILSIWELYIRDPYAQRYAIFQDDLILCRGVKEYLEVCEYPVKGYLNLFTFLSNEHMIFKKPFGWHLSDQLGRGAIALVFDHLAVVTLLQQENLVSKPQAPNGNQNIDGCIQESLVARAGFKEYVHSPSLAQHTGITTTIGNNFNGKPHPQYIQGAKTFPGEKWNVFKELTK